MYAYGWYCLQLPSLNLQEDEADVKQETVETRKHTTTHMEHMTKKKHVTLPTSVAHIFYTLNDDSNSKSEKWLWNNSQNEKEKTDDA